MEVERPVLVVFQGGARHSAEHAADGPGRIEDLVSRAQQAAALDLLAKGAASGAFGGTVLVTDVPALAADAAKLAGNDSPVVLAPEAEPFHFGEELRRVCRALGLKRVVYVGGGAVPLAEPETLVGLATAVAGSGECVVANTLFSADMAAFHPASALDRIALPATDNNLAWLLHYSAGLSFAATPRTLATGFDIDTPPDLAVLHLAGERKVMGAHLLEVLEEVPRALPRLWSALERAYAVMTTRRAQLFVAGRISAWTWRRLEVNLPCQTRVLSEERGLLAGGRGARGEARSLLGYHLQAGGPGELVSVLTETCDAAFIDTRVLFAHRRLEVSSADRFASDALEPSFIEDAWVRELTAALAGAKIPVVLGGHSLVSGGLWALSEWVRSRPAAH